MPRPSLVQRHQLQQSERAQQSRLRRLRLAEPQPGARVVVEGREYLGLADNDYLGLADHPALKAAAARAIETQGVGARSAHLILGHGPEHAALEREVAEWLGQPAALLFGSGYLANLGVLQGLLSPADLCVQDKLNHACLLDGAKLSGALLRRYPHADVAAAERQLQSAERPALLATDGVFSMDGDLAPLQELTALCQRESVLLYVDDAHGAGVLGACGRGTAAELGVQDQLPLQLVTLGKAFGAYGGVVAGQQEWIEAILQSARPYLFATALPAPLAAAARAALRIIASDEGAQRRAQLHAMVDRFVGAAAELGLPLLPSRTAIQPLLLGDDARCMRVAAALAEQGIWVGAIRPPTVPAGQARLRIALSARHTEDDVDRLLQALHTVLGQEREARE
ncbi:8-amino-7-oxononanoate synthase [Pseudomarimonas arenosa]|uniref:8-amino-7-oxononanoate synthase n=1 Tax=Pseudomarimonas arenosa TaxID=2774145 RepID=A0AAW3ZL98_9GAMM|nr:8-amino-7-oxononanoate synthase [Pseudomarimonas arenosa]MBD8525842.1 8-amino-7-oxononanoate synthase [Pseudomarimonas arenosa]